MTLRAADRRKMFFNATLLDNSRLEFSLNFRHLPQATWLTSNWRVVHIVSGSLVVGSFRLFEALKNFCPAIILCEPLASTYISVHSCNVNAHKRVIQEFTICVCGC